MAVVKLLNLLAISCLAVIASFGPVPVAAVSVSGPHHARSNLHQVVAAKKRRDTKRCKPRTTTKPPAPKTTTQAPPPPPKTTQAPAPAPKPTKSASSSGGSTPPSGGKRGLGIPIGNNAIINTLKGGEVSWYYSWSPWRNSVADAIGMEFCPQFWGIKQASDFQKLVKPGFARCALGMNEPNQVGQANISPGDAVGQWWTYLEPLHSQGYYLVSPAPTSAPSGKTWLQSFLGQCNGCHVDAIGIHYYGTDAQDFIKYMTDIHNTFNKRIWVTEFACQNFGGGSQANLGQVFSFMNTVVGWMESTDFIERYAWFGFMFDMSNVNPANQLISGNSLSSLGHQYAGI